MDSFTFWKGVKNTKELSDYLEKTGELPECEMFKYKRRGDNKLIAGAGFIEKAPCDNELFKELPETLKEALN